jgi:hypothetical protein
MTISDEHPEVLAAYTEHPMQNGDVAILTDQHVVQEICGLADAWDPRLRRSVAELLREGGAAEVEVCIARPDGELLAQDHALWADLREELLEAPVTVHPLTALPAAA